MCGDLSHPFGCGNVSQFFCHFSACAARSSAAIFARTSDDSDSHRDRGCDNVPRALPRPRAIAITTRFRSPRVPHSDRRAFAIFDRRALRNSDRRAIGATSIGARSYFRPNVCFVFRSTRDSFCDRRALVFEQRAFVSIGARSLRVAAGIARSSRTVAPCVAGGIARARRESSSATLDRAPRGPVSVSAARQRQPRFTVAARLHLTSVVCTLPSLLMRG